MNRQHPDRKALEESRRAKIYRQSPLFQLLSVWDPADNSQVHITNLKVKKLGGWLKIETENTSALPTVNVSLLTSSDLTFFHQFMHPSAEGPLSWDQRYGTG